MRVRISTREPGNEANETSASRRLLAVNYSAWVVNVNSLAEKCSGQSRYGRYGFYATEISLLLHSCMGCIFTRLRLVEVLPPTRAIIRYIAILHACQLM